MSDPPPLPNYSLPARISAGAGVLATMVACLLLGAGQFGHAFIGLFSGLVLTLKWISFGGLWIAFAAPLLTIALMIGFFILTLFSISVMGLVTLNGLPRNLRGWAEYQFPMALSLMLLVGLLLGRIFPGVQEVPVTFTDTHFVYPLALLVVALLLKKYTSRRSKE